ncbi:MAG: haloacid dehalogenase type II [Caldilineaceae bacterium]|nr:haloacid dehalogenase type II [Caldilineaceae bacterium]
MTTLNIRALTFDIFGTVVDWRSTIMEEGARLGKRKNLQVDWGLFADHWRAEYGPSMDRVRQNELGWTKLDDLHKQSLYKLLHDFGIIGLSDDEIEDFNKVWHRLHPWPDAVQGIARLRERYIVATLSNGNFAMLVNIAKTVGIVWDCILSAELAHCYKPDARVYRMAADLLSLPPSQILMVAAHPSDLKAAARVGFRTAYIPRPQEHGPDHKEDAVDRGKFDMVAADFNDLAAQLDA